PWRRRSRGPGRTLPVSRIPVSCVRAADGGGREDTREGSRSASRPASRLQSFVHRIAVFGPKERRPIPRKHGFGGSWHYTSATAVAPSERTRRLIDEHVAAYAGRRRLGSPAPAGSAGSTPDLVGRLLGLLDHFRHPAGGAAGPLLSRERGPFHLGRGAAHRHPRHVFVVAGGIGGAVAGAQDCHRSRELGAGGCAALSDGPGSSAQPLLGRQW